MKRALLLGGAVMAMVGGAPYVVSAEDAIPRNFENVQLAEGAVGEVDAGKLIGQDVYDNAGEKVGDIESVMVDKDGKVNSVVLDVSGWLEAEKLIAVQWSDLKAQQDGKIVTALTKDAAEAAAAQDERVDGDVGHVVSGRGTRAGVNDRHISEQRAQVAITVGE